MYFYNPVFIMYPFVFEIKQKNKFYLKIKSILKILFIFLFVKNIFIK